MKTLKFYTPLANLICKGEKYTTWRLFDDKNLQVGDAIQFVNKDTGDVFGHGEITHLKETTLGDLQEEDWKGHEKFTSLEKMYSTYRGYYGDEVNTETKLKVIHFNFVSF